MNLSKRHHFIPVFYLKQFTNEDGYFYIYDVNRKEFKNRGRKFAPKSHFFEYEGNTTFYGLEPSDFIEGGFSNWDNKVANIFQKIVNKEEEGEYNLNSEEWTMLQYFVNIMYWRNPSNEYKIRELIKNAKSISDFKLKLMNRDTDERASSDEEIKLLERIKTDPDFIKFLKSMLPATTYPEIFKKEENDFAHIFPFPPNLPKLVSDNPIIYRNLEGASLHTDEFIFPLTPRQVLIRNHLKGLLMFSHVRVMIDMMLLMQAKQYISCTDLQYPRLLSDTFEKHYSSIEQLREKIFKSIYLRIGA